MDFSGFSFHPFSWTRHQSNRVRFVAGRIDIGTKFGTFGLREKQETLAKLDEVGGAARRLLEGETLGEQGETKSARWRR